MLLVGAGLLIKSYRQLRAVDLGCATHDVLTMWINLPKGGYRTPEQRVMFYEQLLERVRATPGVQAAGLTSVLPGQGRGRDDTFNIREHAPMPKGENLDATTRFVDPGYFAAMQIPLIEGRFFEPNERLDKVQAIIVNREFTREVFPGEEHLGKHIVGGPGDSTQTFEIVGVVGDTLDEVSVSPIPRSSTRSTSDSRDRFPSPCGRLLATIPPRWRCPSRRSSPASIPIFRSPTS